MTDDDDLRERHMAIGMMHGRFSFLQRMCTIYGHREARRRPRASWGLLPLDLEPEVAIELLMTIPAERKTPAITEEYVARLEDLRQRRNAVSIMIEATHHEEASHVCH